MHAYSPGDDGREEQIMLRLIAVAAVAVTMGAIGVSTGQARITLPQAISTIFYGLSGR